MSEDRDDEAPLVKATVSDMKEGLTSARKADITHIRTPFMVYGARACEYGSAKYERANYLRPTLCLREDFLRLRAYLRAAVSHIHQALDAMEAHQALDPRLEDEIGMRRAAYAEDFDEDTSGKAGPSGLPHLCGAVASLNMAITQATRAELIPADPGQPWAERKRRAGPAPKLTDLVSMTITRDTVENPIDYFNPNEPSNEVLVREARGRGDTRPSSAIIEEAAPGREALALQALDTGQPAPGESYASYVLRTACREVDDRGKQCLQRTRHAARCVFPVREPDPETPRAQLTRAITIATGQAPRCAGEFDDGIADGNTTRCRKSAGCGLAECPSDEDRALWIAADAELDDKTVDETGPSHEGAACAFTWKSDGVRDKPWCASHEVPLDIHPRGDGSSYRCRLTLREVKRT